MSIDMFGIKYMSASDNQRRRVKKLLAVFQTEITRAYDKGYKNGVADEITCVENSGEHLDLQAQLKGGTNDSES